MSELLAEYSTELGRGCKPDSNNEKETFWYSASGMTFDGNCLRRGNSLYPLNPDILTDFNFHYTRLDTEQKHVVHAQGVSGTPYLFTADSGKIYRYNNKTGIGWEDLTDPDSGGYIGDESDLWSIVSWGDWTVASNGQEQMQLLQGSGYFRPFDTQNLVDYAKVICVRSPFLVAFNEEQGGAGISWCHADALTIWQAARTNLAGRLFDRNIDSEILAAILYQGNIAYFTANQAQSLDYIQSTLVFGITNKITGIGVLNKNCVCTANGYLWGIGPGGIWMSDLSSKEYIDVGTVKKYISSRRDISLNYKAYCFADDLETTVWFYFPVLTAFSNGNTARMFGVGYNWQTKAWVQSSDSTLTAGTEAGIWPKPIVLSSNPAFSYRAEFLALTSDYSNGLDSDSYPTGTEAVASSVQLDLGDPNNVKFISELQFNLTIAGISPVFLANSNTSELQPRGDSALTWPTSLSAILYYKIDDSDAWSEFDLDISQGDNSGFRTPVGVQGRYFQLVIYDRSEDFASFEKWELHKVRFFGTVLGSAGR